VWVPTLPWAEAADPAWTAKNLSDGIAQMRTALGATAPIWVALPPERRSGASFPIEADDPWSGVEADFWTDGNGAELEGLLFLPRPGTTLLAPELHAVPGDLEAYPGYTLPVAQLAQSLLTGSSGWPQRRVAIPNLMGFDRTHDWEDACATPAGNDRAELAFSYFFTLLSFLRSVYIEVGGAT
jgi:hypothetical protein